MLWDDAQLLPDEKIKLVADDKIRRVVLCSGKVYYDLYEEREKRGIDDIYLLRVEQLYPFPTKALVTELVALQAGRDRLVPGGAAQHGRLELRRALSRMGARTRSTPSTGGRATPAARPSAATAIGDVEALAQLKHSSKRRSSVKVRDRLASQSRRCRPPHESRTIMAEIRVPTLGESVTEATIGKWFKKPGDAVAVDEPLVELETDKVTIEVPAPAAGVLAEIAAKDGETVAVGALLGQIKEGAGAPPARPKAAPAADASPQRRARVRAAADSAAERRAAGARRCARWRPKAASIPRTVAGTGKDGRVTKGDMLAAIERAAAAPTPVAQPAAAVQVRAPSPADDAAREERVKMTRLRQTIARRLKEAQNTAAMLTTFNEVDMSAVMALRNQYKELFEKKHGVKLGFMGFFVRACVQALKDIPAVNAEIDGTDLIYKNYYHIGVAVGTEKGLVVPVVRDCDQQIARRDREEDRRLRPPRPRRQAQDRGDAGRHLHHHQRRRLRLADVDADPQRAAVRHPRHAQDPGAADGGRRQDRDRGR